MKWLDKLRRKKEPATEKQIEFIRKLGNEASDEKFIEVLTANGFDPSNDASAILGDLSKEKASSLIEGFLFVPATDKQIEFIQNEVLRWDPSSFEQYGGASQTTLDKALAIAEPRGDYQDRQSFSHLSKRDASLILERILKIGE